MNEMGQDPGDEHRDAPRVWGESPIRTIIRTILFKRAIFSGMGLEEAIEYERHRPRIYFGNDEG